MVHPIGKRFFKLIISPFIKKIDGLENVPAGKNFIIAANHSSYMDHLIIASTFVNHLNKRMHFLAKKEHFEGFFQKRFHEWADAIPLDRQAGGKEALKWAIEALKKGKIISIYPEGTRTLDGKVHKGKTGIARLALAAKVPVLPVGIIGTFEMMPKGKRLPGLRRAAMRIGRLMYFDDYYGKENDPDVLRKITDDIMNNIARLAGKKYEY